MPSMGELIFMPFHVTCVCEGAVPRNEAVAIVPRPYDLMNTGVLCDSRSPKLLVTFCRSATESRFIFVTPMSARRRPVTTASFSRIVREERGSDASGDSQTVSSAALREAVVSVSAAARAVLYSRFIAIVI